MCHPAANYLPPVRPNVIFLIHFNVKLVAVVVWRYEDRCEPCWRVSVSRMTKMIHGMRSRARDVNTISFSPGRH